MSKKDGELANDDGVCCVYIRMSERKRGAQKNQVGGWMTERMRVHVRGHLCVCM